MKKAFTLIELLIVVAIIAILAAIAVPNFLEAQVRAKVSRGRSDMRSIQLAIECYRMDTNTYPPNHYTNRGLYRLSTPIAYLSAVPSDVFQPMKTNSTEYNTYINSFGKDSRTYIYHGPQTFTNANVASKYNIRYVLKSPGPDQMADMATPIEASGEPPYDPTNGTISRGNVERVGPGNIPEIYYRNIWNNKLF